MATLHVEIVTQEEQVLAVEATQVSVPGHEGEVTILPHHQPLTSILSAGEITIVSRSGEVSHIVVSPGFVQVVDNRVTILADSAVREDELSEQRALEAKAAAEAALQEMESDSEVAMTLGTIERTVMELRAIRRRPKHRAHSN
jgi:F-type H+-transporting ATPase subunit epsilon